MDRAIGGKERGHLRKLIFECEDHQKEKTSGVKDKHNHFSLCLDSCHTKMSKIVTKAVFETVHRRDTAWGSRQKGSIWLQVGLTANDQLRQRVAWAFAQLLVLARGAIEV